MNFVWFLCTMVVAFAFGLIAARLKLPMGAMVGAMVGVAALNLLFETAVFYKAIRVGVQILTGAMIGSRIGKKEMRSMKQVIFPTALLIVGMIIFNLVFGGLIYALTDLDVTTSLFAVAPGGMTDMAIIAGDLGANPAYVAILQIFRILIIVLLLPPIFKYLYKKTGYDNRHTILRSEEAQQRAAGLDAEERDDIAAIAEIEEEMPDPHGDLPVESFRYNKRELRLLFGLFLSAAAGGLLLYFLNVTAGAIIGAMLGGMAYSVIFGKAVYPKFLPPVQQVLAGAYIGASIDRATVASMDMLLLPTLIMIFGIIIFVLVFSFVLSKLTKLDYITSLLVSVPGGITEMSLLSEEFGADTPKIAVMHTARLILVILTFPTMLRLITGIIG